MGSIFHAAPVCRNSPALAERGRFRFYRALLETARRPPASFMRPRALCAPARRRCVTPGRLKSRMQTVARPLEPVSRESHRRSRDAAFCAAGHLTRRNHAAREQKVRVPFSPDAPSMSVETRWGDARYVRLSRVTFIAELTWFATRRRRRRLAVDVRPSVCHGRTAGVRFAVRSSQFAGNFLPIAAIPRPLFRLSIASAPA